MHHIDLNIVTDGVCGSRGVTGSRLQDGDLQVLSSGEVIVRLRSSKGEIEHD
eukprot:COSAG05_NODE_24288_length_252_cov_1.000000_1_plen_51_part_10